MVTSFIPEKLTTTQTRLHQIAVPINRLEEVMYHIFQYLARTGKENLNDDNEEIKMLSDIHWISLTPDSKEISNIKLKNVRFAVDLTDKLQIRQEDTGGWKGFLEYDDVNDDPRGFDKPVIGFDPQYWRPDNNMGKYNSKSNKRGVLFVFQEDGTEFINIGILTLNSFRVWAYEVLSYISYGENIYTDISSNFNTFWTIQDITITIGA